MGGRWRTGSTAGRRSGSRHSGDRTAFKNRPCSTNGHSGTDVSDTDLAPNSPNGPANRRNRPAALASELRISPTIRCPGGLSGSSVARQQADVWCPCHTPPSLRIPTPSYLRALHEDVEVRVPGHNARSHLSSALKSKRGDGSRLAGNSPMCRRSIDKMSAAEKHLTGACNGIDDRHHGPSPE